METRNVRYERRRQQAGLVKITVWVPADAAAGVKAEAERLCAAHLSSQSETTVAPSAGAGAGAGNGRRRPTQGS